MRSSMHHHSLWINIELANANANCDASVIKKFEEIICYSMVIVIFNLFFLMSFGVVSPSPFFLILLLSFIFIYLLKNIMKKSNFILLKNKCSPTDLIWHVQIGPRKKITTCCITCFALPFILQFHDACGTLYEKNVYQESEKI